MGQSYEEQIRFGNDEIIVNGNLDGVDEIFATDYVVHSSGMDFHGTERIKKLTMQLRSAIPDLQVVEIEFLIQAGDTIAWKRTFSGTHQENIMDIPPSGLKVEWRDMVVTRFENGMIVEEWAVSELAGQLLSKSLSA